MSATLPPSVPWTRARPTRGGPKRGAGGMYRTAEGKPPAQGGVPLNTANAAVVAAVRLAYEVAEAQVERSTRLARRLREAGDQQAGPYSDSQALDATERLVMKTLLSGLEWWEGSVAEGRCPVKRLAAAEYRMLGTILGFAAPDGETKKAGTAPDPAPPTPDRAQERKPARTETALPVVLRGEKKNRRRVVVQACDLSSTQDLDTTVFFHCAEHAGEEPIDATLDVDADGTPRLLIEIRPGVPAGRWACAVCDRDGVQVGSIELLL